jgi:hypothetical protein
MTTICGVSALPTTIRGRRHEMPQSRRTLEPDHRTTQPDNWDHDQSPFDQSWLALVPILPAHSSLLDSHKPCDPLRGKTPFIPIAPLDTTAYRRPIHVDMTAPPIAFSPFPHPKYPFRNRRRRFQETVLTRSSRTARSTRHSAARDTTRTLRCRLLRGGARIRGTARSRGGTLLSGGG